MLALGIVYIIRCFVQPVVVLFVCDTCSIVCVFLSVVQNMVLGVTEDLQPTRVNQNMGFIIAVSAE